MFNLEDLIPIVERIAKGSETEDDTSIFFELCTKIGLRDDDIQGFIKILRGSKQSIKKESESNEQIKIILQNVVQLGDKSNNFGDAKDFTIQNFYQSTDTKALNEIRQALQELQNIHKLLLEKNNVEGYQTKSFVSQDTKEAQAFVGVASKIVQQNIPVVVAMQYEISNITACQFAYKFYEKLAQDEPVDIAAQNGRRTIALETQYRKRDFATPIVFMRVKDGYLFKRQVQKMIRRAIQILLKQTKNQ